MLTYLTDGWFCPAEPQHTRAEVFDGALDSAGLLTRQGVSAAMVLGLQRLLTRHGPYREGPGGPSSGCSVPSAPTAAAQGSDPQVAERRHVLLGHILDATDGQPALQGFVMDCMEAAHDARSWQALCGHLEHIGHLMAALHKAQSKRPATDLRTTATGPAQGSMPGHRPSSQYLRS